MAPWVTSAVANEPIGGYCCQTGPGTSWAVAFASSASTVTPNRGTDHHGVAPSSTTASIAETRRHLQRPRRTSCVPLAEVRR